VTATPTRTKYKRKRSLYTALKDVRKGVLPAGWTDPPPPPKPARGPRDESVPDPADYWPTPERVAADQRAVVADAVRAMGRGGTPERIGDRVHLAADVVRRRLAELAAGAGR
jgi:hypothetical protein